MRRDDEQGAMSIKEHMASAIFLRPEVLLRSLPEGTRVLIASSIDFRERAMEILRPTSDGGSRWEVVEHDCGKKNMDVAWAYELEDALPGDTRAKPGLLRAIEAPGLEWETAGDIDNVRRRVLRGRF